MKKNIIITLCILPLILSSCSSDSFSLWSDDESSDSTSSLPPAKTKVSPNNSSLEQESKRVQVVDEATSKKRKATQQSSEQTTGKAGLQALDDALTKKDTALAAKSKSISANGPRGAARAGIASLSGDFGTPSATLTAPVITNDNKPQQARLAGTNNCFVLTWLVPTTPVSIYHIKFGPSEDLLTGELTLPVELITKNDSSAGPVYSQTLLCNSRLDSIYVKINAESRFGMSEFSAPFQLTR